MGLKVILWFPQASQRWLPRLVAAIFMTHWTAAECLYKYKQWPELSLSASDIPLGESVPQLPSLFPTAHYHFTYRHQTSCYGEHKAKYLRVWDQRMSTMCIISLSIQKLAEKANSPPCQPRLSQGPLCTPWQPLAVTEQIWYTLTAPGW